MNQQPNSNVFHHQINLQSIIQIDQRLIPTNPNNSHNQVQINGKNSSFSQFQGQINQQVNKSERNPAQSFAKKTENYQEDEQASEKNAEQNKQIGEKTFEVSEFSGEVQQIKGPITIFDDVPIGKTGLNSKFVISEFQEDDGLAETNFLMSQKLKSREVKLKLEGMNNLLELLTNDPTNNQISQIQIGELLKETNPACLQKILQCLKVWVEKDKKWGDDETKNCIEYGYINGKPNTKKLSVQVVDLMYEKSPDVVQMAILGGLKGVVPKKLAGYIAILNELLFIYGIERLKFLKPYFPILVIILNREKQIAVKTEGMILLKQSYKWLSMQVVQPVIKDIREGLKKQLQMFWQTHQKHHVMTAPKDIPKIKNGKPKKKVDAYYLSEEFDVFQKFNKKWMEGAIHEQKWGKKVTMMKQFYNAASAPKLFNSPESKHVSQMISSLINHSNVNLVFWDLKILAVLSKGLRKHFSATVKVQFLNVIKKLKCKRPQIVDEALNTLSQFHHCISIEDVIDDVKEGLRDQNLPIKIHLLNWITKFAQKQVEEQDFVPDQAKDALKSLFPVFESLLTDVGQVRNSMKNNIEKMRTLMGDDFFAALDK